MGMARWVVVAWMVGVAIGATPGQDRPDITMLYKGNTKTCVAGGNTNGYGLAFMSETLTNGVYINQFEYRDGNDLIIDSKSDCDFERRNRDTCWSKWYTDTSKVQLQLRKSGSDPISPVTDDRWNSFVVYQTNGGSAGKPVAPTYDHKYDIAQESFFTGISIRSTRDAQILLCNAFNKPSKASCYYIIIDGFGNSDFTTIRKCVKGVPDTYPKDDDPDCKMFRANITAHEKLLDESKWTHFMLSREGGNRIRLWLWDLDTGARPLLDYTDDDPLSLSYMYVRSYNAQAAWKVHEYKYVQILNKRNLISLGPLITFAESSPVCVSLYVTLCSKCIMDISLEREDATNSMRTSIKGDSDGPFMTWRNVRLQGGVSTSKNHNYQLYVRVSTTDATDDNTFWAIDDFRKCSNNEYRVLSTTSYYNLLCHSLNLPNWKFYPSNKVESNEPPICENIWQIGQHCNISCYSVNPNNGCDGQKMCMSTQEGNYKGACTCASGYTWGSDCIRTCNYGYYGYNCEQECGRCKHTTCYINTGQCAQGCEDGYLPPYCQTTYPRLISAPEVVQVFYTKVTIKFNNLDISGDRNSVLSIQLECKTNKQRNWGNCSKPIYPKPGQEISITGLQIQTTYLIRAIIYTTTGDAYRYDDVPTVEVTTRCKVDREIQITETSRNATIYFKPDTDGCSVDSYIIALHPNSNKNILPHVAQQNEVLSNLTPYTNYSVTITNTIFPNYVEKRSFQTKQEAPGIIKDLSIFGATDTIIILSWKEPEEKNGVIQKYTVKYELTQRIRCNSSPNSHSGSMIAYPSMISEVTISDLQPYSTYYISVAAETLFLGMPIGILGNTSMISDISEEELPEYISTADLTAQSVTITWPVNCLKHRGPLYFQIVLKCMKDEWCNQIPDIVLDNINSINGAITTHDLTPFTHYSVVLRAQRSESGDLTTFNRTTELYSPEGNPPVVRNSTYYSKDNVSISLRWLDPYPPHGHLEKYAIKYCYYTNSNCKRVEITTNQLASCDLWNERFNCYKLTDLHSNHLYTITITAKNRDINLFSRDTILKVYTAEDKSSAPLNITREWINKELKLSWNHPDITNGELKKFIITLNQTGTELENQDDKPFYSYETKVLEEMKTYSYKIDKTYRYSSSYTVTVCGVNTLYGENTTLQIDTPPETPELTGEVTVIKDEAKNTSVIIKIPGANNNTKSKTSYLYVVVSKTGSSISKRQVQEESNLAEMIRRKSKSENSWIAIEKDLNEGTLVLELGDNNQMYSDHLKEIIHNKELEPSSVYDVTVVLINHYKGEKSFNVYKQTAETIATLFPASSALFALLLLLLLPVVVFIVYRYIYKKETRRASMMMMIPGLRVTRSEDQHDPDVIPLTEASTEPAQNKPRKPATTPKPGPSTKPPETTVTVEVNTTGTTFFHSRIVLLENLEDYLKEALENGDLDEQHALFPRGQTKPWDYGMLKPNKFKNRYSNLIAYDKNRVKLEKINNDQYSDYINASYIHGYRQDKAYIATQGPKLATVNDFWRMIWQEKTIYIVMLANVVEAGKKKCEKYWPEIDSSREYGFVDVYFEKSEVYADYEYRTFELTCKGEKRKVTQLHFTSWPDHGVPLYPQSLVPFLKKMLTIPQSTAPVVVHCSAGVGRTGTIILCDICLRMAAREKAIDALRYLHEIREQRANMVDNIDQYKLVHMVLLECLLAPDTNIPCNADLSNAIQKLIEEGGLQIQLNHLQQSSWQDKALNFASTKEPNPANESKNRYNDIVPSENQVYISRYPIDDENSDYINAVPVDGFRFKEQFIVTQTPMPNTVKDFWRMIAEKSVKIIVSLNDIPSGDKTSCIFWPPENEEMKPVPNINLKHHKLQSYDYYDIHSIVLDNKSSKDSTMIQVVQFKNWTHETKLPRIEENLVMLWEETENLSHGNYPMVVTCYDGATASGLFVAMSFVIEKIKLEQQCDPCLAVRVVRRNRKQFVSNKVQFEFLYRSAVIYLSMFETYSNFQPVVNKQNK